ncbi:hypothetical protein CXF56_10350, partial [Psychrobacter sp. Choline-02u-13]
ILFIFSLFIAHFRTRIVLYHTSYGLVKQTHTAFIIMGDAILGAILYTKVSITQILICADILNNSF